MTKNIIGMIATTIACSVSLSACVTNDQGQVVMDPRVSSAIMADLTAPPAPAVVVAEPVYEEAYVPGRYDSYIVAVADQDVVIIGGNTYIWEAGPDGHRHKHFYAHGDHREDVFHRRDDLHAVMAQHGGALPSHRVEAHMANAPGMQGGPGHGPMLSNGPGLAGNGHGAALAGRGGFSPQGHQVAQQNHPAAAHAPAPKKEEKKS